MSGSSLPPDPWVAPRPPGSGTAAPTPVTPPSDPGRRPRRWVLLLAAVVAIAGVGVAVQQRQVAAAWRERAEVAASEREDALGRGAALQRQLDEVAASLALSEDDVVDLESRIRELADEKARAEDTATTVQVERDTFVALASSIASSVAALDTCVEDLFGLLNDAIDAFNRQGRGEEVDVAPLNTARTQVADGCNAARTAAAGASATADALLR